MEVTINHIGVATVVFTANDSTFITDPCFDCAGNWYHHGWGAFSKKTGAPRLDPEQINPEPAIGLVTHGHHADNLDGSGQKFLESVGEVVSTKYSARSIAGATGLSPGEKLQLTKNGSKIRIHAVHAQHGVFPLSKLSGPVNGYVIEFKSEDRRIYVSGDTIYSNKIVSKVLSVGSIDLFFPHLGNAYFPYLSGPLRYTMNAEGLENFVTRLKPTYTYPIHNEGWTHFRTVDFKSMDYLNDKTTVLTDSECGITV